MYSFNLHYFAEAKSGGVSGMQNEKLRLFILYSAQLALTLHPIRKFLRKMDKKFKRTLVTSALPYANGGVHIGHLAGVYVPADIYVRYLRLKKEDVLFICGSDEHGVPVTMRARKEGCTPQDVVDRYHALIKKSFEDFGISFDTYGRTSSDTQTKLASDFFRTLYDKGIFLE